MKTATNEQEEAQRKKDEELRNIEAYEDLKKVMSTDFGLRFIQRIFAESKPFARGVFGNSKDYVCAGKRDFALWVWQEIWQACPEKLPLLAIPPKEVVIGNKEDAEEEDDL